MTNDKANRSIVPNGPKYARKLQPKSTPVKPTESDEIRQEPTDAPSPEPARSEAEIPNEPARLTVFASDRRLVKRYSLGEDGKLVKEGGGAMTSGSAVVRQVRDLTDLRDLLTGLKQNEAVTYGVHGDVGSEPYPVATRDEISQGDAPAGARPRTADRMAYPTGPSVIFLDHDPEEGTEPLTADQLIEVLTESFPLLAGHAMMTMPSSSSYIYDARNGSQLQGLRGQRLYLILRDGGEEVPRVLRSVQAHLWAAGHGWIKVSRSGALLTRTTFDASTAQPNRFDFSCSVATESPVESRPPEPVIWDGKPLVDSREVFPDPDPETERRATNYIATAKSLKAGEAAAAKEEWIAHKAPEIAGPDAEPEAVEKAKAVARRFLESDSLDPTFPIQVKGEDGKPMAVTVADVLRDKRKFDGAVTLDPAEPEYDGSRWVGKLFLHRGQPTLFSMAHGGKSYFLAAPRHEIAMTDGEEFEAEDQIAKLIYASEEIYCRGGRLERVGTDGSVAELDAELLGGWVLRRASLSKWVKLTKGWERRPMKASDSQGRVVFSRLVKGGQQGEKVAKPLDVIVNRPVIATNGDVLRDAGYYERHRVLVEPGGRDVVPVPDDVSIDDRAVEAAVRRLLRPFREFPLEGATDWAVLLSALLSAAVRPTLPKCPAFAIDAPTQGSGKTLLAQCVAELSAGLAFDGLQSTVWAYSRDNLAELDKRLESIIRHGEGAAILDNVLGTFDSPALAAILTSPAISYRPLYTQRVETIPNRTLLLMTGNNIHLGGDMPRRVLTCRIDPAVERPDARSGWETDPMATVTADRMQLISDALTVVRGCLIAGSPAPDTAVGSFEDWDRLVRRAVLWVRSLLDAGRIDVRLAAGGELLQLGDPRESIDLQQAEDSEVENLERLISGCLGRWSGNPFTARDVLNAARRSMAGSNEASEDDHAICAALEDWASSTLSEQNVGKILGYRKGRIVSLDEGRYCLRVFGRRKRYRIVKRG